jgi:hypothetical protein
MIYYRVTKLEPIIELAGKQVATATLEHSQDTMSMRELINAYVDTLVRLTIEMKTELFRDKGAIVLVINTDRCLIIENLGEQDDEDVHD